MIFGLSPEQEKWWHLTPSPSSDNQGSSQWEADGKNKLYRDFNRLLLLPKETQSIAFSSTLIVLGLVRKIKQKCFF